MKSTKKVELVVKAAAAAFLVVPMFMTAQSGKPVYMVLAALFGSVCCNYIELQTEHLFKSRERIVECNYRCFKIFSALAGCTVALAAVLFGCESIKMDSYDKAYLANVDSRIQEKGFTDSLDECADFVEFYRSTSEDYYSAEVFLNLINEDIKLFDDASTEGENAEVHEHIELPGYTSDNPIIIDMIYTHYALLEEGVTQEQATAESQRVMDMCNIIIRNSLIRSGALFLLMITGIMTTVFAAFNRYSVCRNLKLMEKERNNEESVSDYDGSTCDSSNDSKDKD